MHKLSNTEVKNTMRPMVFSGSFDPWTYGHESVVTDYLEMFPDGKLIIVIGVNPGKQYTFSPEERKFLIESSLPENIRDNLEVDIYEGVISDYVFENNYAGILKGVRDERDFAQETLVAQANGYFSGKVKTILIPQTRGDASKISSSATKAIFGYGGDTGELVPVVTREALRMKQKNQLLIGVTGGSGCGKSTISRELTSFSQDKHIPIHHIDVDQIVYRLYQKPTNQLMRSIQAKMIEIFGPEVITADEMVNRKMLSDIVFSEPDKKRFLEELVGPTFLHELKKEIHAYQGEGIILIDWALFAEFNQLDICDKNILLVHTPEQLQTQRITTRDELTDTQAELRMNGQLSSDKRIEIIKENQTYDYDRYFSQVSGDIQDVENLYTEITNQFKQRQRIIREEHSY